MCELMMQNGKNHDIQKILHILSVSSQKLGHSAFAEGYKMKLNDESLSSIISHEIMAELEINNQLPSSLKGNILGPKSEGVFLFSEYEKLMASFEDEHWMQTLFVKLRKWAFKSDFYENPFSEITASKYISFNSGRLLDPKLELLVDIPLDCFCENLIIRNIKLNSEIKNELDNSVTISRYLKGVSSNQLQSLCLAANVTINNITKNSEVESNVTLLAVNSLRYLGLNEVALRTLYHSQQVSYWLKNYYAAKILANDLKFDKAVPLLNDALNHVENKTQAMKVAICLAHMMYKSMSYTESKIRTAFAKCFELNHENAKVHFLFSCYVEEISNKDDLEMMYEVMKSYANTAILSDKYDRIACSKVFSILFLISEMDKFKVQSSRIVQEIQETAKKWTVKIPAYKILPNITQIASKLCKCEQSITSHLETLVLKVLLKYPHTTIWKISNYIISKDPMRKDKYNFIVAAIKSRNGSNQIWNEYLKLIPLLVDLCTFNDSKEMNIFISKSIPKLKLLSMSNIAAPTYWTIYRSSQIEKETVFFCELEDRVEIFPSLQRPKKVAVICTDGLKRIFLFKPKDDLRKDMRFLELAVLINSLLLSSGKIKVYSALPLNEDAGIIEWVDQTTSLRSILYKLYKEINLSIQYPEFQKIQRQSHLVKKFVNAVLPRFPPQLQRWFMRKFLSPFEWFKARHIFIKSTSTISIFGHIMGLGDRHCENILICEDDGQCMHVDFNCLFEKGKSLEIPEKVPFRLTQNLTSAFGSSGNIGEFHSQCTKVIKSLKININLIIANLEPMINDPTTDLMVFANKDRTINQMTYKKDVNYVMSRIKDKLSGLEDKLIFKTDHSQVTHLIEQATNPELLSRMYIGWAPFL